MWLAWHAVILPVCAWGGMSCSKQEEWAAGFYWLLVYTDRPYAAINPVCTTKQPQLLICRVVDKLSSKHIFMQRHHKELRSCTLDTFRFSSKQPEGKINGCVVSKAWWYTIIMEVVWNNTLVMWYPFLRTQITVHWATRRAQMIGYREVEMSMYWVPDLVYGMYCCIYLGCLFTKENESNSINHQSAS